MKISPLVALVVFCGPVWAQNAVKVHVVDDKNLPVAGARIEISNWDDSVKPIPLGLTDAAGIATFSLPLAPDGKRVGTFAEVAAQGFAFNSVRVSDETVEVHLERGATWRGQVLDEAGKPLAGAKVHIVGAMPKGDFEHGIWLRGEKTRALYTAQSDAQGRFQIADVPAKMGLNFSAELPKYARGRGQEIAASDDTTIRLTLGATAVGRVLDDKGAPLAQARVFAQPSGEGEGYSEAQSEADGQFRLESLAPGNYNVMVELSDEAKFVVPAAANVSVVAGQTLEIPPLQGVPGVVVRGLVRDADSKKPIAGAAIGLYGPQRPATSGAITSSRPTQSDGRFEMRAAPGANHFYLYAMPPGYLLGDRRDQRNLQIGQTAPDDLVFELKKAATLRGKIVDEAGKPLQAKVKFPDSSFRAGNSFIQSDAKGQWQIMPQDSALRETASLQLAGGDAQDGYFEVVRPLSIDAGTTDPITIVLRRKPWQVLPGRVLTPDGKPLEGVQIEAEFYSEMGDGNGPLNTSKITATSNKNGDFELLHIRDGIRSDSNYFKIKGEKAGYAFQNGGVLSKNGPIWQVSNFIFTPLNLKIEGTTRPGARVTAAGSEIVADADGKFAFAGLAAGARVYAFKDGLFGGGADFAAPIELKPQAIQPRDVALAREIWADIVREAALTPEGRSFRSLGWVERHLAGETPTFESQIDKNGGDLALLRLVSEWAGRADSKALESALRKIGDPDQRLYGFLDTAVKTGDATLGADALIEAETTFALPEKNAWWREMNGYRAAAVAAKFAGRNAVQNGGQNPVQNARPNAGFAALDRAIAYTLKNHGAKSTRAGGMPDQTGQNEMFALQSPIVAQGGRALWQHLAENIEPNSGYDVRALGEAIPVLAQIEGAEAVLPLLNQLEKMPEGLKIDEGYTMQPQQAFSMAAAKVVPLWAAKSPTAALNLAHRIAADGYSGHRSSALMSVARIQTGDEAAQTWREVVTDAPTEMASRFAARAFEADPVLGRELFAGVRAEIESATRQEWGDRSLIAVFAFYFARVDAAQARFLLEREWGAAIQKKAEDDLLDTIAFAMSALDARRAVEMARQIPTNSRESSLETRRKIGRFLALGEAVRRDYPLGGRNYEEMRALDAA